MSSQSIRLQPAQRTGWIISGAEDLTWFIGSSLVSYCVLAMMAAGFPLTPLYLIWLLGIDGPHVWATITRTYFDSNERRKLGTLLWFVLPALMIGPAMVTAGAEAYFYIFAITWLHLHIAKQHFGFVMLYKHKAGERNPVDYRLDRWFLLASLMLPFARFLIASNFVVLSAQPGYKQIETASLAAYGCLAAVFLARQALAWRSGQALNGPKLLLIATVAPLQWLTFGYAMSTPSDGIIRAGIVLGLFHSFQYHRLMWFHNRNHYGHPGAERNTGLATTLARRFVYYAAVAVLLNLLVSYLPGYLHPNRYLSAAMWGIPFTHYFLDSKIWRVRGNKALAAALRLA